MKDKDKDGDPCSIDVPVPTAAKLHEIVGAIEDALEKKITDLENCKSTTTFTINVKFK
jgi:hypothetical protein